jgi:ribosome-associated protein
MDDDFVSKTKRKQQMHELQTLGAALLALSPAQLDAIGLEEVLAEALREARGITSHEARRRQVQYIGKLMREVDPEPIREALAKLAGNSAAARARQRRLEQWRERLIEDDAALTEFAQQHAGTDLQALRALIRNARREIAGNLPPRARRELFRRLREALEEARGEAA